MASESHASGSMKYNAETNERRPPKRNCTITKEFFNSETKCRVKDMLDKALQLRQNRLNIEQAENTIYVDDTEDFKEAPRFKRQLRLKNKSSSLSSSVTNVIDVIVIDAENQPSSDTLSQSREDRNGCEEFTHLKNVAFSSEKEITGCDPGQRITEETGSAVLSELITDQVKDDCRMCLMCGKKFGLLAFKSHSIDCLKQNFSKPDRRKAVTDGSIEQVKCHICNRNITYMNTQRRQQHVNECIDKEDATRQEEIEHQRQLEVARSAVLNCPMCGRKFKVQSSRQSHLKKCALNNKMTVEQVRNLVKQQEEEHQSKLNTGILPDDFIPTKLKPIQGKQASTSRLKSQFDEDTQLALALSTSLAEDQGKEDLAFNGLLGNTNCVEQAALCSKGRGKNKKAKSTETASLLVSLPREDARKRISDRVTRYTFPPNQGDSDPTTPPFKTTQKREFESALSTDSGSVKSVMQVQPDWWSKASQATSSSHPCLSEMSSEVSIYYVKELMPPVSVNSVFAGSKVKRLSCIPGRRRSGEMEQHHSLVGLREIEQGHDILRNGEQHPEIIRSRETKQHPGSGNTGRLATISHLERVASQDTVSSPLSQTVDVLTKLAMESDLNNSQSISARLSNLQPDSAGDSDDGEYTVEPSGFCKESPIKVRSDSNDVISSYLGLVNCPRFSDLVIMTDRGTEIHAHKIFLHARCPELLSMSLRKDEIDVVDLTTFSRESVLCFLKFVYAGQTVVYSSCQADVKQLAERFSVAGLKDAISISDMGSVVVEDVQETENVGGSHLGSDSNEEEDRNERSIFDDDDWLDVFQTQRDNMRLKSEGTSAANSVQNIRSESDSDMGMDADDNEVEERNGRNTCDNNEWQGVFLTQRDNMVLINDGDHESRNSEEMEQSEALTENVDEEIDNSKLLDMTNEYVDSASVEKTTVVSDINVISMEMKGEDDDDVFHTIDRQFCGTKYNSNEGSKDVHVVNENDETDVDVSVCEEEKVLAAAENNESKVEFVEISDEEDSIISVNKDGLNDKLFTNEHCKAEVLNLEDANAEDKNTELILVPNESKQNVITSEIEQNVIKNESSLELTGISILENSATNESSLELTGNSFLENSSTNDISLKSSEVNILETSSLASVNLSINELKIPSQQKKESAAGGSKPQKRKKTRVSVKEFKGLVHKALSGFSNTCQPLANLTDEDINKMAIKIEQGLQTVNDPNDSVYIPSVLEDTGETSSEVIITHADIKTTTKQNCKQGKKSQAKTPVLSTLFVEHLKPVVNSALVAQGLHTDNTLQSHEKLVLRAGSMQQPPFQNGKTAPQISTVTNSKSVPVISQKPGMNKHSGAVTPTSRDERSTAVQMQASSTTTIQPSLLTPSHFSGKSYVAELVRKCVKSQTKPCSSQLLNNSTCASQTVELVSKDCLTARALFKDIPVRVKTFPEDIPIRVKTLPENIPIRVKTLPEDILVRSQSSPSKAFDDSFDDDILRNCQSEDSALITNSVIPKLISPSAKSTNSEYISGEELFTDNEDDPEPSKTQVTYRSPSDPSWILSTQQISFSSATEESIDTSIRQEVGVVRRNIFLQELAGAASVTKTPHSAELSTTVSRSGGNVETAVTQSLTCMSTVGSTVKDTKLETLKENQIFKQVGRSLTSNATCVSGNNVDNTHLNMHIDLSLHLLHQPDSAVCVEGLNAAADPSDQVLSEPSSPTITSRKTNKDSKVDAKQRTELAPSPETIISQTPEVHARHSKTVTLVKDSQPSVTADSRKAADAQSRSFSHVTIKTSSVGNTTSSPVKHMPSDDCLNSPVKTLTDYCHLRKSIQGPERHKSVIVTQSSTDEKSQVVIKSTHEPPSLNRHLNVIHNMDMRPSFSETRDSISRFSKNTESLNRTSPVDTERLVPVTSDCDKSQSFRPDYDKIQSFISDCDKSQSFTSDCDSSQSFTSDCDKSQSFRPDYHKSQSSMDRAKSPGHAGCKTDSVDRIHAGRDTAACSLHEAKKSPVLRTSPKKNNTSAAPVERKPTSEQNMLSVRDNGNYSNITDSESSFEKSGSGTDKTCSDEGVSTKIETMSSGVCANLAGKLKPWHQDKVSLTQENDSSDLDSPLPLRKRLGLTNPFQYAGVKQPGEMMKQKAASVTFPHPESSIPKENTSGQSDVHCTSVNNQDREFDDHDLLCIEEEHVENMPFEFTEKTDNAKTPKQQTLRRLKNVKKAGTIPSPFTPMAPYDDMATPDLKKAVTKIGVRPLGKKRMREFLKRVYHETHQYETDSDYDGTPVKHKRSSSQPSELSTRAKLSHLPIKATARAYTQKNTQPVKKAKSNKVNQTEKKSTQLALVKHMLADSRQKSTSQSHTQETLGRGTLGNDDLTSDDYVLHPEDTNKDCGEVSGSQESSFSSDGPDLPEESILQGWPEEEGEPSQQVQSHQPAVAEKLVQFVRSNSDVYESILMYEPLELDVLKKRIADSGIKVSMAHLMDFLDEKCITFTVKNMVSRNNNRHRKPKKSGKIPRMGLSVINS